jgi:hypothetical protein
MGNDRGILTADSACRYVQPGSLLSPIRQCVCMHAHKTRCMMWLQGSVIKDKHPHVDVQDSFLHPEFLISHVEAR